MDEMENEMMNKPNSVKGEMQDRKEARVMIQELEDYHDELLESGAITVQQHAEGKNEIRNLKSEYRHETNPGRTSVKIRLLQKKLFGNKTKGMAEGIGADRWEDTVEKVDQGLDPRMDKSHQLPAPGDNKKQQANPGAEELERRIDELRAEGRAPPEVTPDGPSGTMTEAPTGKDPYAKDPYAEDEFHPPMKDWHPPMAPGFNPYRDGPKAKKGSKP